MTESTLDKGGRTEELLREYFITSGYYAVRGVPVTHDDIDITDIDIWLYLRPSPLSRERVNVDAKQRSSPKAMERILWTRGLQAITGLERCVVATTDSRPAVKEFGLRHNVLVLDGSVLSRLSRRNLLGDRLTEEELAALVGAGKDDKLLGNWRGRLKDARGRLVTQLEFDGCNAWLEDVRYFIDQSVFSGRDQAACRLAYLMASYFLIGLDYTLRTLAFEEVDVRRTALTEGFRYGSRGRGKVEETLSTASQMLLAFQPDAKAATKNLRSQVVASLESLPVDVLGEFFSRTEVAKELFNYARSLEHRAYARDFMSPGTLDASSQAVLGVLMDFFGIDRTSFLQ